MKNKSRRKSIKRKSNRNYNRNNHIRRKRYSRKRNIRKSYYRTKRRKTKKRINLRGGSLNLSEGPVARQYALMESEIARQRLDTATSPASVVGLGEDIPPPEYANRIGIEIETCLPGIPQHKNEDITNYCFSFKKFTDEDDFDGKDIVIEPIKIFERELIYFVVTPDLSIKCSSSQCSVEFVLRDDKVFTYHNRRIYMDNVDVTITLMDEFLMILSKSTSCQDNSCGLHVHISDRYPKHGLNTTVGKIFLLRALSLWCGIKGKSTGYQNSVFKEYLRIPSDILIKKGGPLQRYLEADDYQNKTYADLLPQLEIHTCGQVSGVVGGEGEEGDGEQVVTSNTSSPISSDKVQNMWTTVVHPRYQKPYYYNSITKEARWDKPQECFSMIYEKAIDEELSIEELKKYLTGVYKKSLMVGDGRVELKTNPMKNYALNIYALEPKDNGDYWNDPLRIEFRGHKDLMIKLSEIEGISPEDYLLQYLEDINNFFETARRYNPLR